MDRQLQDQLDESAGQEMVRRVQELSGNLIAPLCKSCGGNFGGLHHYSICISGAAGGLGGSSSLGGNTGSPNSLHGVTVTEPTARERYVERFKALQAEMLRITLAKNNDYGGQEDPYKNFRMDGAHGILIRAGDKMSRLRTAIVEKRKFAVDESIKDTCLDLANYALLLLCFLEEGK